MQPVERRRTERKKLRPRKTTEKRKKKFAKRKETKKSVFLGILF